MYIVNYEGKLSSSVGPSESDLFEIRPCKMASMVTGSEREVYHKKGDVPIIVIPRRRLFHHKYCQ